MNIPTDAIVMTIALVAGFIYYRMKKTYHPSHIAVKGLVVSTSATSLKVR